jgi:hypothetical protein
MIDEKEIDEVLDEATMVDEGGFEGTLFLSTDGKMTVSVKSDTRMGRKNAYKWATETYKVLKENYGSKQAQAVKEYKKAGEEGAEKCKVHPEEILISAVSKKTGKPYKYHRIGEVMCFGHA